MCFFFRRIAGLNERKAKEIISWREQNGAFRSREQLKLVRGIGEKTFEQCAGFVRIFQPCPETIVLDDSDGDANDSQTPTRKRKTEGQGPSTSRKKKRLPTTVVFNKLDSTSIHPESYAIAEK